MVHVEHLRCDHMWAIHAMECMCSSLRESVLLAAMSYWEGLPPRILCKAHTEKRLQVGAVYSQIYIYIIFTLIHP